jgi:hypothetical protein
MNKYLLAVLFSAVSVTSVQALENQKTVCSHSGKTRVIEVAYSTENTVPCEVRYSKEEGSQVLWSAANAVGYCEEKAAAFVEKQKAWGWNCEASMNTITTDEAGGTAPEVVLVSPEPVTNEVTESNKSVTEAE